jgi:hypothetical protein
MNSALFPHYWLSDAWKQRLSKLQVSKLQHTKSRTSDFDDYTGRNYQVRPVLQ